MCARNGNKQFHGPRILNRWRTEESVVSRPRSGRPRALTEDVKRLRVYRRSARYFTWESLATLFTEKQVSVCAIKLCIILVETLERCWDVKTAVTKCILDANGTTITSCRTLSSARNPSDDVSLDLDDTDDPDPVARTLDYEGLHASYSLLLSHDKFMLHKLRLPRFALSCNSRKKTRKNPREFTNHEWSQKCLQGGSIIY